MGLLLLKYVALGYLKPLQLDSQIVAVVYYADILQVRLT